MAARTTAHEIPAFSPLSDVCPPPLEIKPRGREFIRHLRAPRPIHFPEVEKVPEGTDHFISRAFLHWLLRDALGDAHTVGCDQFVYWRASSPKTCLSPDVFVKLNRPYAPFGSWRTWECGGTPELAIEIISPNEGDGVDWDVKIDRYHDLGVAELVRFDPKEPEGHRLRVWDRVDHDLVERDVSGDITPCHTLGLIWVVSGIRDVETALRLADYEGNLLMDSREHFAAVGKAATQMARTATEQVYSATEQARAAIERAQEAEAQAKVETAARAAAEARILELEAALRGRG